MARRKSASLIDELAEKIQELKKAPLYFKVGPTTARGIFHRLRRAIFANSTKFEKVFAVSAADINKELQNKLYDYIVNQKQLPGNAIVELHVSPLQRKMIAVTYLPDNFDEIS